MFASEGQTLSQSYSIAKNIFRLVGNDKIDFVLIGLSPYIIPADENESPIVQEVEEKVLDDYFKLCVDNGAKPVVVVLQVKWSLRKIYNADVVKLFRDTINKVGKKYNFSFIDLLDDPCMDSRFLDRAHFNPEGPGPAFTSTLITSRLYLAKIISRENILNMPTEYFNTLKRYYPNDYNIFIHHVFCEMACEDFKRLSATLPQEECKALMARAFSEMSYSYLANLVDILPKDAYNELTTRIFNMTLENIHRKDKIKVGFYLELSSHWCGDNLYNLFAGDKRFEPTIFVPIDNNNELSRNELLNDLKKFKTCGLNIFEIKTSSSDIPKQDIIFRLRPYKDTNSVPTAFRLINLKAKETLVVYIPYSFDPINPSTSDYFNLPLINIAWKNFIPSAVLLERYKKSNKVGMPHGIYSGYPKLDVFFKPASKFHFDWKMTRPDAKKIIWAPHWSINWLGIHFSTFQWNYQFMYEFAKAHPEISWVIKPHPLLLHSTRWSGLFPSDETVKEYFQKWDDLPNARFYTGTYYNDIFATSDGMIHDCCSFTAEYQYVDKPMIFLTRPYSMKFDELGEEILKASYTVDGKDFEAIATMIQRVFIEGDDYKAAERKAVFDKYLNYPKINGMSASEFIYKSIAEELELKS